MKLDKRAVDLLMARKCWGRSDLIEEAGISSWTYYEGIRNKIAPKYAGLIARALNARVEDIIIQEED